VDALDECPRQDQRGILLQKLEWLRGRGVRSYVSSATHGDLLELVCRFTRDIEMAMADMAAAQVLVEPVADDVRRTIVARLAERHPDVERLLVDAGEDVDKIIDKIVRDSDGMFAIACLSLDRKPRDVASLNRKGDVESPDPAEPPLFSMRTVTDHVGRHPAELSFRRGEVIAVTEADTGAFSRADWEGAIQWSEA
jgi:hypothetical protein